MSPRKPVAEAKGLPLAAADADRLLTPLRGSHHLALAVSGGADSMALMLLAARSSLTNRFSVLTVDHGLRPEAAAEAEKVVRWAMKLGFEAHVLKWTGKKPRSAIQENARKERYRLMAEWCASHGAEGVVTAHTLDDQAETLLMRLGRGSGVDGLSAMPSEASLYGITVFRPLLDVAHDTLKRFVVASGQDFIEDPSNVDPAFERIRIRNARLTEAGLRSKAIALSARRLQRARQALDQATDVLETAVVRYEPEGHASVVRAAFETAPLEIRIRLLSRLLAATGGLSDTPTLAEIERIAAWLQSTEGSSRTLGGCRIQCRQKTFLVGREKGRMGDLNTAIRPGEAVLWDARFIVSLAPSAPKPLELQALGAANSHRVVSRPKGLPQFVFETLPALLSEGEILLVPQLSYRREGAKSAISATVRTAIRRT